MRRRILITNDDGIASPGLLTLAEALNKTGEFDLRIVAPESEQTGAGHGLTLFRPLTARREKLILHGAEIEGYAVGGTPADCAKLAIRNLFSDFKPELVLSGINRGLNVGTSIVYSGTVAGALEAVLNGVPAIALSLEYPNGGIWQYTTAASISVELTRRFFSVGLPPLTALNVNFPSKPRGELKGVRRTSVGVSGYEEGYVESHSSGDIRIFHIEGEYVIRDTTSDFDAFAIAEGWVTCSFLVPSLESKSIIGDSTSSDLFTPWLDILG